MSIDIFPFRGRCFFSSLICQIAPSSLAYSAVRVLRAPSRGDVPLRIEGFILCFVIFFSDGQEASCLFVLSS